jgi:signal transduction histidine kinase
MAVLGLIVVAGGAAVLSDRIARANALADAEAKANRLSRDLVGPVLQDALTGAPGMWDELQRRVRNRLQDHSIKAIIVWTDTGQVLYCSDNSAIGRRARPAPELLGAIAGKTLADVADSAEIRFAGEGRGPLVKVYAPLSAGGRALAFEVYFDAASIDQDAARLRGKIIPLAVGALIVLQLVQTPVAVSFARRARVQDSERAELLARGLAVSERERRVIAADVHEGPVQRLGHISEDLVELRENLPSDRTGVVERLSAAVDDASTALRRLIVDLHPAASDDPDIATRLEALADTLRQTGLEVTVTASALPHLSPDVAAALYRTAKEAMTNVVRHAHATRVWVTLEPALNGAVPRVRLSVTDDGVGFSADHADRRQDGHLGLRLMADRASDAGGILEFGQRPGGGATVTVVVPALLP